MEAEEKDDSDGDVLVIAIATGYCKELYVPMARECLIQFEHVLIIDSCGHGDSDHVWDFDTWTTLFGFYHSAMLNLFQQAQINIRRRRLYGFGHSFGGACLIHNELAHPGTFSGLCCHEPIIFDPNIDRSSGNPLVQAALKRTETFPSRTVLRGKWRGKGPFQYWTDECLDAYIEHGFRQSGMGESITLKMPKELEAKVFGSDGHHSFCFENLPNLRCPIVISAEEGSWHEKNLYAFQKLIKPDRYSYKVFAKDQHLTHFMPFENPSEAAKNTLSLLDKSSASPVSKL